MDFISESRAYPSQGDGMDLTLQADEFIWSLVRADLPMTQMFCLNFCFSSLIQLPSKVSHCSSN